MMMNGFYEFIVLRIHYIKQWVVIKMVKVFDSCDKYPSSNPQPPHLPQNHAFSYIPIITTPTSLAILTHNPIPKPF